MPKTPPRPVVQATGRRRWQSLWLAHKCFRRALSIRDKFRCKQQGRQGQDRRKPALDEADASQRCSWRSPSAIKASESPCMAPGLSQRCRSSPENPRRDRDPAHLGVVHGCLSCLSERRSATPLEPGRRRAKERERSCAVGDWRRSRDRYRCSAADGCERSHGAAPGRPARRDVPSAAAHRLGAAGPGTSCCVAACL